MKAIINLTTISELPCEISHQAPTEVNFEISKEYATADLMNNLQNLKGFRMFSYSSYVSIYVHSSVVESIVYVD